MDETLREPQTDQAPGATIQTCIAGAIGLAETRGAGRRAFLSGLWQATMGTLLAAGTPQDVILLLFDRAAQIKGQGLNADAPVIRLDPEARERRVHEASIVAQVIVEELQSFAEDPETAETFPEDFLDAALAVLVLTWGPSHLRRALAEQMRAIEEGTHAPVLPAEPAASNQVPRVDRRPPAPAATLPTAESPPATVPVRQAVAHPVLPAPVVNRPPRRSDVHLDSEPLSTGRAAYAVVINMDVGDRRETREICGTAPERTGSEAAMVGLLDALLALGPAVPGDSVRISTPVEAIYRAMVPGAPPQQRPPQEHETWGEIERLASGMPIEWCLRRSGTVTDLAQRCDRLLRARSAEAEREAMAAA